MPDYNLTGLSTRSFEQLIQAIAIKVIAPGVIVYGDGPDGGREASFEGETSYPSANDAWNGYIVIQAKFKQRPLGNSAEDGKWALEQLKSELRAFASAKKTRRKPDYYIFATNVVLTPVQDQGFKDKAYNLVQQFSSKVPIKGYEIWDYDKIRSFLDNFENIRRAYAAWVTPGDVLSDVISSIKPVKSDFEQVISNFLQKELVADQYANLEQAGHTNEERIPLACVFTDLPFSNRRVAESSNEVTRLNEEDELSPGIVAKLVETSKHKFDPESISLLTTRQNVADTLISKPQPGRFVVIGGPGQGKTTVSQFLCQLFRAAILKGRSRLLETVVRQALEQFENQCNRESIELPTARRFPFRVVLSEFATALATKKPEQINSLLAYIADRIRKRTTREVSVDDLRNWLRLYPWLIVLDGLDEVPASSNRDEVLSAIQDFWIDATEINADIMVVATTRPQGYNQDFSPELYGHIWLTPLSPARSLYYARRLTEVRYVNEPDRQEKIISRLERAAENEATTRLMRSPLQVTIMTVLVDRVGQPPQERWNLFRDYYKVIYEREVERNIPASQILREYRVDVDIIHKRVGLLLQVESERSGRTDARLSLKRFAEIVEDRLTEEGHEEDDRNTLKKQIIEAAGYRLVFLVGLELDEVGFEIRSLQEFMASEALMDGSDEVVKLRIEEIASISNWRNVFLFAAGKCFAEKQHLRDSVYSICAGLNEADDICTYSLIGSQLALDILEDGSTRRQPKFLKMFARLALRLLDIPSENSQIQLADTYVPELEALYKNEIERRISTQELTGSFGAWICLIQLADSGIEWSRQLFDKYWLKNDEQNLKIFNAHLSSIVSYVSIEDSWSFKKLEEILPSISPTSIHFLYRLSSIIERSFVTEARLSKRRLEAFRNFNPPWLGAIFEIEDRPLRDSSEVTQLQLNGVGSDSLNLIYCPTGFLKNIPYIYIKSIPLDLHFHWESYIKIISFSENPSKASLVETLNVIAESYDHKFVKWLKFRTPWQISSCLASSSSSGDLLEIIGNAENGELGDTDDWFRAEERWTNIGLTERDFVFSNLTPLPFTREIAECGFPFSASTFRYISQSKREEDQEFVHKLIKLYFSVSKFNIRQLISRIIFSYLRDFSIKKSNLQRLLSVEDMKVILNDLIRSKSYLGFDELYIISNLYCSNDERGRLLDFLSKESNIFLGGYYSRYSPERFIVVIKWLVDQFIQAPESVGILRLLSLIEVEDLDFHEIISTIPNYLLEIDRYSDSNYKESAAIIKLMRGDVSVNEFKFLVESAVKSVDKRSNLSSKLLTLIREGRFSLSTAEQFLLELSRTISQADYECFERALEAANELLAMRTSNLGSPEIWSKLNLPGKLGSIVLK